MVEGIFKLREQHNLVELKLFDWYSGEYTTAYRQALKEEGLAKTMQDLLDSTSRWFDFGNIKQLKEEIDALHIQEISEREPERDGDNSL